MVARILFAAAHRSFPLAAGYFSATLDQLLGPRQSVFRVSEYSRSSVEVDESFVRDLLLFEPAIVALSCFFWNTDHYLALARLTKQLLPRTTVVIGGPSVGAPADAHALLGSHPEVDAAISGEADFAFPQFVASALEGSDAPIDGVVRRDGTKCNDIEPATVRDLSSLPMVYEPSSDLVRRQVAQSSFATIETLRGCRRHCRYCLYQSGPVRLMPVERVESELAYLCELGVRRVRVADSHFGGTRKRAHRLLETIARVNRGTSFTIYPDPAHVDAEYLALARAAGCRLISFGVQTLDRRVSERLGRRPEHEELEQALAVCRAHGAVPQVDLMYGLPGQDAAGLAHDFEWLRAQGVTSVLFSPLMLFTGTPLANEEADDFAVLDLPQRFARPRGQTLDEYTAMLNVVTCAKLILTLPRTARCLDPNRTGDLTAALAARALDDRTAALSLVDELDASAEHLHRSADGVARRAVALLGAVAASSELDTELLAALARVDVLELAMRKRQRELASEPLASVHGSVLVTPKAIDEVRLRLASDVWLEVFAAPRHWVTGAEPASSPDRETRCVLDCRSGRLEVLEADEFELLSSFRTPCAPFAGRMNDDTFRRLARWCARGVLEPSDSR